MRDLSRGYESPKQLIERIIAAGLSQKDIAANVGLSAWAIGKILKNDSDTASIHWFKLKKLAGIHKF